MSKNNSKNANRSEKKHVIFSKRTSAIILCLVFAVLVLGGVFSFVSLELGITDYKAYVPSIKLGLDLEGGVYAVYEAQRPEGDEISDADFKSAINGSAKMLQDLLFSKGFPEAQVSVTESNNQIRVEVPAVKDQEEIFDLIGRPASLEMHETDESGKRTDNTSKPLIEGKDVKSSTVGMDENGKYIIALAFNKEGTKKFADATTKLQGKYIGIFINKEFLMAPKVEAAISDGKASITGDYTYEKATELSVKIQSGAMAVKLNLIESDTISPTLGKSATRDGLIAGGVGLLLIIIFMIARYRMLGVAASISLIFFTITYLFFLSIFPWVQLTLPGIAGILLSIGMAVDANVIIFERVKEVRKTGKSLTSSINIGFKNSYSAILDGNVTTVIGALVLILLGAAAIKGFAITLLIGIIISLFSSLIFTRMMLKTFIAFNDNSDKLYGTGGEEIDYNIYEKDELIADETVEIKDAEGKAV